MLDVEFSATRVREPAVQDGQRRGAHPATAPGSCAPACSWCRTRRSRHRGDRHPAPYRRTGQQAQTGHPVISVNQSMQHDRALPPGTRRTVHGGLDHDPVPRQPGAGHPRAVQVASRRGDRYALRAGDRGPGHRASDVARRWRSGLEMVRRIAVEIEGYVVRARWTIDVAAGTAANTSRARVENDRTAGVARDYLPSNAPDARRTDAWKALSDLDALDRERAARARRRLSTALGFPGTLEALDGAASPRGLPAAWRRCPRLPATVIDRLVEHFGRAAETARHLGARTCGPSRAWARPAPGRCARACPGWPSPRSWSGTSRQVRFAGLLRAVFRLVAVRPGRERTRPDSKVTPSLASAFTV